MDNANVIVRRKEYVTDPFFPSNSALTMGRPVASERNKYVAVAFAKLMMEQTNNADDIVARCGLCSVYALLKCACPTVVREGNIGPRDGVSEVEFNKALQVRLEVLFSIFRLLVL